MANDIKHTQKPRKSEEKKTDESRTQWQMTALDWKKCARQTNRTKKKIKKLKKKIRFYECVTQRHKSKRAERKRSETQVCVSSSTIFYLDYNAKLPRRHFYLPVVSHSFSFRLRFLWFYFCCFFCNTRINFYCHLFVPFVHFVRWQVKTSILVRCTHRKENLSRLSREWENAREIIRRQLRRRMACIFPFDFAQLFSLVAFIYAHNNETTNERKIARTSETARVNMYVCLIEINDNENRIEKSGLLSPRVSFSRRRVECPWRLSVREQTHAHSKRVHEFVSGVAFATKFITHSDT